MKTKQQKCSETQKGRVVIHKGNEEKRIYKDELQQYLQEGWERGFSKSHCKNNGKSHVGKQAWNKGKSPTQQTKDKISNSLKKGYSNNRYEVWNKGLSKDADERIAKIRQHRDETMLKKYGRVGTNNGKIFSEEHKKKIGEANKKALTGRKIPKDKLIIKLSKEYVTKKANDSFNKSSSEEHLYKTLLEENKHKTILRQYKEERYPFYCDFYIVEDDLFIELNAHWTHGGKPYDPNDNECQKQLAIWQEKAKTSQFFQNAIQTWTVRDVEKQRIAKENNLNYKVIY